MLSLPRRIFQEYASIHVHRYTHLYLGTIQFVRRTKSEPAVCDVAIAIATYSTAIVLMRCQHYSRVYLHIDEQRLSQSINLHREILYKTAAAQKFHLHFIVRSQSESQIYKLINGPKKNWQKDLNRDLITFMF